MNTITPIETRYKGCRFRSRLEARWAFFFDQIGIQWEYENYPVNVCGENYLPDFRLQWGNLGVTHEVKPENQASTIRQQRVYLAGKMRPEFDWRGPYSPLIRDKRRGAVGCDLEMDPFVTWCDARYSCYFDSTMFELTGPFPSACDHGCGHSPMSLHMAQTCAEEAQEDIVAACRLAIEHSDIVCAHIETPNAYGTLIEIGFAKGLRKKVSVSISRDMDALLRRRESVHDISEIGRHDLWFAETIANASTLVYDHEEARSFHAKFIREKTAKEFRLISTIAQDQPACLTFGDPLHVVENKSLYEWGVDIYRVCRANIEAARRARAERFSF